MLSLLPRIAIRDNGNLIGRIDEFASLKALANGRLLALPRQLLLQCDAFLRACKLAGLRNPLALVSDKLDLGCFHVIIVACTSCRNDEAANNHRGPSTGNQLQHQLQLRVEDENEDVAQGRSSSHSWTQPDGCLASLARWLLRLPASLGCLGTSLQ